VVVGTRVACAAGTLVGAAGVGAQALKTKANATEDKNKADVYDRIMCLLCL